MGKCFVTNCKTGYKSCKDKISLFSSPKDPERLKEWIRAIPRADKILSSKDVVCAKHFREEDIVREWKSGGISIPYKKARLSTTAVPSIFPGLPAYLTKKPAKKRRPLQKYDVPPKKTKTQSCTEPATIVSHEVEVVEVEVVQEDAESKIFKQIWNGEVNINLPSRSWGIHFIEDESVICISQVDFSKAEPRYFRQLILQSNLEMKFFIENKSVFNAEELLETELTIKSVRDLEMILVSFHKKNVCRGGPFLKAYSKEIITTNVAEIEDNEIWRHKNCLLLLNNLKRCTFCSKLFINFERQKQKGCSLSNDPKETILKLRMLRHNDQKAILRYQHKISKLQTMLQETKNKYKNLQESM